MKKRKIFIVLLFMVICQLFSGKADAAKAKAVRAGFFPLAHFYEFNDDYEASGYGSDYLKVLAMQGGWEYQWVYYLNWEDALEGLKNGEIDILAPAQRNRERESEYNYMPFPIGFELGTLYSQIKDDNLDYMDMAAFQGKTVGCTEHTIYKQGFENFLKLHNTTVNFVYYKNSKDLLEALRNGKVELILDGFMAKEDDLKILAQFGAAPIYFLVNKNQTAILDTLTQSATDLNLQQPGFQPKLALTYFKDLSIKQFTKEEKAFINKAKLVRVGLPTNNFPSSVYDKATRQFSGVDVDILELISKASGLKFEYIPLDSTSADRPTLLENNIDLLVNIDTNLAASTRGFRFSNPYMTESRVFLAHKGFQIKAKQKVLLGTIDTSANGLVQLRSEFPEFELFNFATTDEALTALRNKEVDMVIQTRRSLGNYLQSPQNSDLEILSLLPSPITVSYAQVVVKQDSRSLLIPVLNTAIQTVGLQRIAKLEMDESYKERYHFTAGDVFYVYKYPLGLALALIAVCWYSKHHSYLIKQKNLQLIADNEAKMRNITNNINGGVLVFRSESEMEITFANDGFWHMLGFSEKEPRSKLVDYKSFVHHDDLAKLQHLILSVKPGQRESIELKIIRKDGTYVQTLFSGTMAYNGDGEKEFYCVLVDMSEQAALTQRLKVENTKSTMIFDKADEIIYDLNFLTSNIQVSQSMQKKLGWTLPKHFDKGATIQDILAMWHIYDEDKPIMADFIHMLTATKKDVSCVLRLCRTDNTNLWCEVTAYPTLTEQGKLLSIAGMIKDVDKDVKEQRRLKRSATTDALTGLYNKAAFEQIVKEYLAGSEHPNGILVFIDLDHFKSINDTLGHIMGDQVLLETAQILRRHFIQEDCLARFGGDEFCILLKDIPEDTLQDRMSWLLKKLKRCYGQGDKQVTVSGSIGYAKVEDVGNDYKTLLDAADQALYQAKNNGRNQFVAYKK